jgi:maltose-binding protein MalE
MKKIFLITAFVLLSAGNLFPKLVVINLWHAYRAGEADAINKVTEMFNLSHSEIQVKLLPVPFDAINDKLRTVISAVNMGQSGEDGPDVFVFPHDAVGDWAERQLILPIESFVDSSVTEQYFGNTLKAFNYMYDGALWALPGSFKNIALFYNKRFITNPPKKLSELIAAAQKFQKPDAAVWGLSYVAGNIYYHTMWVQAWGGTFFRQIGMNKKGFPIFLPLLYSHPMITAAEFVRKLVQSGKIHSADEQEILYSFNMNKTLFAISGQWFRGAIAENIDYGVAELPIIDEIDTQAIPFLTVEGFYMASCTKDQAASAEVIKYFTSAAMGRYFAKIGKQTPANKGAYAYSEVSGDPIAQIFKTAAGKAISMPNNPEMSWTWEPAYMGLVEIMGGAPANQVWKAKQIELMKRIEKETKISFQKLGYGDKKLTAPLSVN